MNKKSSNWAQNQKTQNIKKSQRVLQFIISRKKINKSIFNKKFWNRNWWWMSTKMWFVRVWMHCLQVIFFKNLKDLNIFLLIGNFQYVTLKSRTSSFALLYKPSMEIVVEILELWCHWSKFPSNACMKVEN